MAYTLTPKLLTGGIELRDNDGVVVGVIDSVYRNIRELKWQARPVSGPDMLFASLEAAQFYILAMGCEARELAK